ncbi:thioredoxin family protein [Aquimarina sp. 2201CG5-10]|uniref:thioredoxin family protein n=1 Tax=Aquimarina callyspongiae TaxID=3098150 RepID=UPI002AB59B4D|nr:thioredoxin family protein [Aquimarina sp. 2201CG5-10]MDY8135763.1 thioredoxin family protein [Aquimarina sp. 2201CG5-10]
MNKLAPIPIIALFLCLNVSAQNWKYDFEEAKTLAKEENKNILLLFTGSDWCPPCIKMERNILSKDRFKEFADSNFVWVKADFPKRKRNRLPEDQRKKNEALADKYNKKWVFPVILVINKDGNVLGATGYRKRMTVDGYISLLTTINSFGK